MAGQPADRAGVKAGDVMVSGEGHGWSRAASAPLPCRDLVRRHQVHPLRSSVPDREDGSGLAAEEAPTVGLPEVRGIGINVALESRPGRCRPWSRGSK